MFRFLLLTITGAALLGTVGCSGNATGGTDTPMTSAEPGTAIESLDVCSVFTPEDLKAAGVASPGQPETQLEFEPGCVYEGERLDLTLYKNQQETVESYAENGSWDRYERFMIGERQAARAVEAGGTGQGCSIVLNTGGGVVLVDVTGLMSDSLPNACADAEEVATKVAPRLPE